MDLEILQKNDKENSITGVHAWVHPYGCSQMGGDQENTQKTLAGLARHPNAAGVLVLGLGCENNNIKVFKEFLGDYDPERVVFVNCQDEDDEVDASQNAIDQLIHKNRYNQRTSISLSRLKVGLKCGGSDGFSGICANPLVGRFSDLLCQAGGSVVLTEVPEMFGAEQLLMDRCVNRDVFDRCVTMINDFKQYFISHNQVVYEKPITWK